MSRPSRVDLEASTAMPLSLNFTESWNFQQGEEAEKKNGTGGLPVLDKSTLGE